MAKPKTDPEILARLAQLEAAHGVGPDTPAQEAETDRQWREMYGSLAGGAGRTWPIEDAIEALVGSAPDGTTYWLRVMQILEFMKGQRWFALEVIALQRSIDPSKVGFGELKRWIRDASPIAHRHSAKHTLGSPDAVETPSQPSARASAEVEGPTEPEDITRPRAAPVSPFAHMTTREPSPMTASQSEMQQELRHMRQR